MSSRTRRLARQLLPPFAHAPVPAFPGWAHALGPGVVWMALSKPHYGIHGTKEPDAIGYASSHGCVRLTNWDAGEIEHRIREGIEVSFVDTKRGSEEKKAD